MTDIIVIAVIVVILAAAASYVIRAKRSGKKCIGCPNSGSCPSAKNGSCCSCGCSEEK